MRPVVQVSDLLVLITPVKLLTNSRWRNIDNIWSIGIKGRILFLKQDDSHLYYSSSNSSISQSLSTGDLVSDYFNLKVSVADLYKQWSSKDPHFLKMTTPIKEEIPMLTSTASPSLSGIRMLRQDPWECLCCFICSSNNNIKRISQMVENLCRHFGDHLGTHAGIDYYDFPTPESLAPKDVEQKLRDLGFGYRAKYIQQTAEKLAKSDINTLLSPLDDDSSAQTKVILSGTEYLHALRLAPYKRAHSALLQFTGVGPKVADCVCLMSLDKHDCIPVDTHVWQIAKRDYNFKTKKTSGDKATALTKAEYEEIGIFFKSLWGEFAGWAHSVLFTADLKDLNNGINGVEEATAGKATKRKRTKTETIQNPRKLKVEKHIEDTLVDEPKVSSSTREQRLLNRRKNLYIDLNP